MPSNTGHSHAKTVEDFHKLGQKPRLPIKEGTEPSTTAKFLILVSTSLTVSQAVQLERRIEGYQNQQKLLIMINDRAKIAAQQLNLGFKDICGYDNRLSMNEEQFLMWSETGEGSTALKTGVLGP
jgi:COMPASS component SPP1